MIATWQDWLVASPMAFAAGLIVGFLLASRFRLVKLNGDRRKFEGEDEKK